MGRHALISRGHCWLWLARKIAAHRPLVERIVRHQRLVQALGLVETKVPDRVVVQGAKQGRQIALPLFSSEFRAPFIHSIEAQPLISEEGEDGQAGEIDEISTGSDELEEVSDQQTMNANQSSTGLQSIATMSMEPPLEVSEWTHQLPGAVEPVEVQTQQDHAENRAQPIQAKRSHGRIQELPDGAGFPSSVPLPGRKTHLNDQKITAPKGIDIPMREGKPEAVTSNLPTIYESFDPKVWMERLMGKKGATDEKVASLEEELTTAQRDLLARTDDSKQPESKPEAVTSSLPTTYESFDPKVWMERLMGTKGTARGNAVPLGAELTTEQSDLQAQADDSKQPESKPEAVTSSLPTTYESLTPAVERLYRVEQQVDRNQSLKSDRPPAFVKAMALNGSPRPTMPLAQRTGRFLQPLVGIDPASVPIHQDAIAERLTSDYQADAITIGDEVEIAAGYQHDTPETLGLLAHELTHVARLREPHFIPPVVRASFDVKNRSFASDEEALARHVESQVTHVARQWVGQEAPPSLASASVEPLVETTPPVSAERTISDTWGSLPAPWEPLPDWLVSMPVATQDNGYLAAGPSRSSQSTYRMADIQDTTDSSGMNDGGSVQRAGVERSLGNDETHEEQPLLDAAHAPQPDLDALAQQVYSRLKRRLAVERRREG